MAMNMAICNAIPIKEIDNGVMMGARIIHYSNRQLLLLQHSKEQIRFYWKDVTMQHYYTRIHGKKHDYRKRDMEMQDGRRRRSNPQCADSEHPISTKSSF